MPSNRHVYDYEPVTPARSARRWESEEAGEDDWSSPVAAGAPPPQTSTRGATGDSLTSGAARPFAPPPARVRRATKKESWIIHHGHTLSYAGLFLFTIILYFRPYELFDAPWLSSAAFWLGITTLLVFIPSQLILEGTLTARPREVNLVLLLCIAAVLSMPLAISPGRAWTAFTDPFIKAVLMFIVIVNVVRTERRLKWLLLLSLAIGCTLSLVALNDFRLGRLSVDGYRAAGVIGGIFGNPNDLALYLVTLTPLAVALLFGTRNIIGKLLYGACAVLTVAGNVVTFSRGGFLGLAFATLVLAWKLGRRHRLPVMVLTFVAVIGFFALAPGNYGGRLVSILDPSRDLSGSSHSRRALLLKSVWFTINNPLLGIGMDNFRLVSDTQQVTHNAYTQVSAELGIPAAIIYVMFLLSAFRGLRQIERETFAARRGARTFYYLAVGLQASLVGYMVSSFFGSVAYQWNIYYLVGYAVVLRRLYWTDLTDKQAIITPAAAPAASASAAASPPPSSGREG